MRESWENLIEEITINYWCNLDLITTFDSVLKILKWKRARKLGTKAHLIIAMPVQFHSTINELLIFDEQDSSLSFLIRAILVDNFTIIHIRRDISIKNNH